MTKRVNNQPWIDRLEKMGACQEALDWCRADTAYQTLQDAWVNCHRGEWMIWLGGGLSRSDDIAGAWARWCQLDMGRFLREDERSDEVDQASRVLARAVRSHFPVAQDSWFDEWHSIAPSPIEAK